MHAERRVSRTRGRTLRRADCRGAAAREPDPARAKLEVGGDELDGGGGDRAVSTQQSDRRISAMTTPRGAADPLAERGLMREFAQELRSVTKTKLQGRRFREVGGEGCLCRSRGLRRLSALDSDDAPPFALSSIDSLAGGEGAFRIARPALLQLDTHGARRRAQIAGNAGRPS
jgi:hypothetical protein